MYLPVQKLDESYGQSPPPARNEMQESKAYLYFPTVSPFETYEAVLNLFPSGVASP